MAAVTLRLHGSLPGLARGSTDASVQVPVPHPRSVKDAVEAVGVPHTEVGGLQVDGTDVDLDHRLQGGEVVRVHDVLDDGAPGSRLQPAVPRPVRFVADVHLGTLARRLRVLGFDTWYATDAEDDRLARLSARQDRVLLSRDRGLLCRRVVRLGALLRRDDPDDQLDEVVDRFDLADQARPGTRCPRCNGATHPVARADVVDRLPPGTRAAGYQQFRTCGDCGQLYWSGAHGPDLDAIIDRSTG